MRILFFIIFIAVIIVRPVFTIYERRDVYFARGYEKKYEWYKQQYLNSNYSKKGADFLADEIFEEFAAGAFLKGLNPILIVHDHPPLGRYILSLSVLLFDNANTILILFYFLSALAIFLITKKLLRNIFLSLIPVGIFINEPLFISKIVYSPLPEPIQLPFILFAFYFFIKGTQSKKYVLWFLFASLMLGVVISTRFFTLGGTMMGSMILYFIASRKIDKRLITFVLTLPLSLLVLILSYTKTMQEGYSVFQVLGIQKYILSYHKSKFVLPFTFWDLLLFNRWHTWWGDWRITSDRFWFAAWPLASAVTLGGVILSFLKKLMLDETEKILLLWITFYCAMLSAGYSSTRYFLPLLPFLYIIATSFAIKMVPLFKKSFQKPKPLQSTVKSKKRKI